MTDDQHTTEAFNAMMGELDHPMIIVTTAVDDVRAGCLVGFHAQCGLEPPQYAVWLSKANHTYRVGSFAETFAVHFLRRDDRRLAELFGTTTGTEVDKFASCDWTPGPDGVPLLDGCGDRFVGRRAALLDAGADHVCLMLEPVAATSTGEGPWLGLLDVLDLEAGHPADERQRP